ncbi:copper oxidase [Sesbania bispinosa]|nr:copper oxidase [Sesbania bispinosa]
MESSEVNMEFRPPTKPPDGGEVIFKGDSQVDKGQLPSSSMLFLKRKKRARAELPIVHPKIFGDVGSKQIKIVEIASGPGESSKPTSTLDQLDGDRPKVQPFNIQTALNVKVLSPNHLQFVDKEEKPPDPIASSWVDTLDVGSMETGEMDTSVVGGNNLKSTAGLEKCDVSTMSLG